MTSQQSNSDPARIHTLPKLKKYTPPDDVHFWFEDFKSENVRLVSQWFAPHDTQDMSLPTILMAHGWGGTAAHFREDAVFFARAGYAVMLFDYRGWGESDGRLEIDPTAAEDTRNTNMNSLMAVRELRGYIDRNRPVCPPL
ncbi:alpha/beta hydrolase, partial [Hyphomonas oceanitis]